VTCLARHHNDLTTVMSFVRHEIGQYVPDIRAVQECRNPGVVFEAR
jgi:hypothetical protein